MKQLSKSDKVSSVTASGISSSRSKAAAWAWYLHGGGREGRIITERVVQELPSRGRSGATKLPSRFHKEAVQSNQIMQQQQQQKNQEQESCSTDLMKMQWDCGSLLFDSYELVALSSQIDRGLMVLDPFSLKAPQDESKAIGRAEFQDGEAEFEVCEEEEEIVEYRNYYCLPLFVAAGGKNKNSSNSRNNRSNSTSSLITKAAKLFCTSPQHHHHHYHYHHHFHHHQHS